MSPYKLAKFCHWLAKFCLNGIDKYRYLNGTIETIQWAAFTLQHIDDIKTNKQTLRWAKRRMDGFSSLRWRFVTPFLIFHQSFCFRFFCILYSTRGKLKPMTKKFLANYRGTNFHILEFCNEILWFMHQTASNYEISVH